MLSFSGRVQPALGASCIKNSAELFTKQYFYRHKYLNSHAESISSALSFKAKPSAYLKNRLAFAARSRG
jgi:hypothetical protein